MSYSTKIDNRKRCYTLLAVGKKQLGWSNDVYRDFLKDHGAKLKDGKPSATTMHISDLVKAVEIMKSLGFKPTKKNNVIKLKSWQERMQAKIAKLWLLGYEAGVIRDGSKIAMERWCSTVTKVASLQWYKSQHYNQCIEGLKNWLRREGVTIRE